MATGTAEADTGAPTDPEKIPTVEEAPATAVPGVNEIFAELIKFAKADPLTAVAIAAGGGFALAMLLKSRR